MAPRIRTDPVIELLGAFVAPRVQTDPVTELLGAFIAPRVRTRSPNFSVLDSSSRTPTGRPRRLTDEDFNYVYDRVKADLMLASISGGTWSRAELEETKSVWARFLHRWNAGAALVPT